MRRIQQSGAQKRKLAEEKKQKREESLKNVPKISDMFRANVAGPSSSSTQTMNAEDVSEENVRSGAAAASSEQNIENENIPTDNEFELGEFSDGEFNDETIDFDDEFDNTNELFMNVSTSSRHRDIGTESESGKSMESANRFPTDAALWDLDADITSLQKYWTKLGRFFFLFHGP